MLPVGSTLKRLGPALLRRLRLVYLRLRFPRAHIGAGCDIRSGLHLVLGPEARLQIGDKCVLDRAMTIECHGALSVGSRTIFGHHCTLGVRDSLVIGEDCLLAEMVSVRDHDHRIDLLDVPIREQGAVSRPVSIGRNVWLGAKVTVVKGVSIGDNAVIGANAVVTKDIPANAIAVGIPAKVIGLRTHQHVEAGGAL
ncbi:MAG TPA: acyltransferase [Abditibacteriaceae bacterium]|nr:acyltransferase [Abditibacteriaceae bacterium]